MAYPDKNKNINTTKQNSIEGYTTINDTTSNISNKSEENNEEYLIKLRKRMEKVDKTTPYDELIAIANDIAISLLPIGSENYNTKDEIAKRSILKTLKKFMRPWKTVTSDIVGVKDTNDKDNSDITGVTNTDIKDNLSDIGSIKSTDTKDNFSNISHFKRFKNATNDKDNFDIISIENSDDKDSFDIINAENKDFKDNVLETIDTSTQILQTSTIENSTIDDTNNKQQTAESNEICKETHTPSWIKEYKIISETNRIKIEDKPEDIADIPLHYGLLQSLKKHYTHFLPVQSTVLSYLLKLPHLYPQKTIIPFYSPQDIIVCSPTGSGKTLVYLLAIIQNIIINISNNQHHIHALILTPTRDLALQVQNI